MTSANITTTTSATLIKPQGHQDKHKMSEIDENISKLFDIKKRLGKGAYGIVWKANDKRTCETLAVKKIFDAFRDETDAQRTFREIVFLKALRNHPNIIKLHSVFKATNNLDIYLIFEYMESDLHKIIKKGTILKDVHKRYVMYQLINAIKYIHSGNIIHRDLKPSNVLIDSKCRIKVADFGLARSVSNHSAHATYNKMNDSPPEVLLTDYVATRWYRAPEILVASKTYTKGIDMWSLGCILGELLRGKPLFQGSSTMNQIEKIMAALPEITNHDIAAVGNTFGSELLSKHISRDKKTPLKDLLHDAPRDAFHLVQSLLILDPLGRLTAAQAINHPYVEKFRNSVPEIELTFDVLPPFRDDIRLSVPEYRSKLYEIVQVNSEKNNNLQCNNETVKQRNHVKNVVRINSNNKSLTKMEMNLFNPIIENNDEIANNQQKQQQNASALNNVINKAFKKSNSVISTDTKVPQRKNSLQPLVYDNNCNKITENKLLKRSKSCSQRPLGKLNKQTVVNGQLENLPHAQLNNIIYRSNIGDTNENKIQRQNSTLIRKADNILNNGDINRIERNIEEHYTNGMAVLKAPLGNKLCLVRNIKSEIITIPQNMKANSKIKMINPMTIRTIAKLSDNNTEQHKSSERICYYQKLKKIEEEIKRYKIAVQKYSQEKWPCKNQVIYREMCPDQNISKKQLTQLIKNDVKIQQSNTNQNKNQKSKDVTTNYGNVKSSCNVPIKNTYFQLLTKGHHRQMNENKLELDLSGSNSSSDHNLIKRQCNTTYNYKDKISHKNSNKQQQQQHNKPQTQTYVLNPHEFNQYCLNRQEITKFA